MDELKLDFLTSTEKTKAIHARITKKKKRKKNVIMSSGFLKGAEGRNS
jgi:hypothetical protein